MKRIEEMGRKVVWKALTLFLVFGAFVVFTGGPARAEEKPVAQEILDILLANHEITPEKYKALLKRLDEEKMAEARKIAEAQKAAAEAQKATDQAAAQAQQAQQATAQAQQATAQAQQAAQQAPAAPKERAANDFRAFWRNGLWFATDDKNFQMHVGGRLQVDFAGADPSPGLYDWAVQNSLKEKGYADQARRARFQIDGTIYQYIPFVLEVEFAGGSAALRDAWIGYKGIPCVGDVRVGHIKEALSLEQYTSDNWTTFMERALPILAFIPGHHTGAMVLNNLFDEHMTYQVGYFLQSDKTTGNIFSPDIAATQVDARLTTDPWYQDKGREVLHFGFSFSHQFRSTSPTSSNVQLNNPAPIGPTASGFSNSPEANLFSPLVNTGVLLADAVTIINPEAALVCGPLSVQGEFFEVPVDHLTNTKGQLLSPFADPNPTFYGGYAFISYFLTGEHRPYDTKYGIFGRPVPNCNFSVCNRTPGAWELAFRWSYVNLNDNSAWINAGVETDYTAGINWYLNQSVRVMFNYVHADVDMHDNIPNSFQPLDKNGWNNIFESRFQIVF